MTISVRLDYSPRMPLSRMGIRFGLVALFLLSACGEQAACVEGRVRGRDTVVVGCSTGKIAICGTDPEILYNPATGALLPTPAEPNLADDAIRAMFDGACPGGIAQICVDNADGVPVCRPGCRPRPVCRGAVGAAPTCANGETAMCRLGQNDEIMMTPPPTDAGPPSDGGTDAGDPDAGDPDAGDPDAGDPDAGDPDAGSDAGPDAT